MQAKQIMTRRVLTVGPHMTLGEAARLFAEKRISGAPVVDARGELVGVLSQSDLVRRARETAEGEPPSFYSQDESWLAKNGYQIKDPDRTRVADVMTPSVIGAEENAPVEALAALMLRRRLHRVVITRRGKLAGLVTSMDLLRALVKRTKDRR